MELLDSEKRRARNLIWNAAEEYGFEPDFKAYDETGRADLYWNSVIGAVRRDFGAEALAELFAAFHGALDEYLYEQVAWLALEEAVFQREADRRPALPALRRAYARRVLALSRARENDRLLDVLQEGHFRRSLGQDPALDPQDRAMLDALEGVAALEDPLPAILSLLETYLGFVPDSSGQALAVKTDRKRRLGLRGKNANRVDLPAVRGFGYGFGEHRLSAEHSGDAAPPRIHRLPFSGGQSEESLRTYIEQFFGTPLYDRRQTEALERALCQGSHAGCHLYYTQGGADLDREARGYAGAQRRAALKQMEKNRAAYQADLARNRASIARLTARIRNALLAHLEPTVIRTTAGSLEAGRLWRGLYLADDKLFTRTLRTDPGSLSVDLLLDASTSQLHRQETVSAQGYMIAEALTRCGIPVRVTGFCSLSGYTVLSRFRDYGETERNENIFHYFTTGCNRDGLAVRALGREMEDSPCEHRLAILLSDAKPNDVLKTRRSGVLADYAEEPAVTDTATEVRALQHRGIGVVCVFTGDDDDLPAARTIYGRSFARIRSLDHFADTVGTLIQDRIRELG